MALALRIFLFVFIFAGVADRGAMAMSRAETEFRAGLSAFNAGDYATALRLWSPLASDGEPRAQAGLGFMHHRGLGVPVDDDLAALWLTRAAEKGQADAQLTLGTLYYYGKGVPRDMIRAFAWCDLAQGNGAEDAAMCRDAALQALPTDADMQAAFRFDDELRNRLTRR